MGGRGATSEGNTEKEEFKIIQQLAKDIDLLPNGDLQGEAEAWAMQKYGAQNIKKVITESDRLLNEARRIKDYTDALDKGEPITIDRKLTYRNEDTGYEEYTEGARFRIKNGKVQVSSKVLDLRKNGEWYDHPTFTKAKLLKHLQKLEKQGTKIHT